jgi:hypothetical protein
VMKNRIVLFCLLFSPTLLAGKADVIDVKVRCPDSCTFNVTVKHADSGWDHYANEWVVVAPDGSILGSRVLYHPHVNEQPFTRSLSGVNIQSNIKHVIIRAKDSVHGFGGIEKSVELAR